MLYPLRASALLFATALLASCGMYPTIKGSGLVMTEERPLDQAFRAVDVSGSAEVVLTQGTSTHLTIDCDDNLLPHLLTTVEDGTLRIRFEPGSYRPSERPVYRISVVDLEGVRLRGSVRMKAGFVDAGDLNLRISGSGSAEIEGVQAHAFDVGISGSGRVSMGSLDADSLDVSISGSGRVEAEGGSVRAIESTTSGSGDLIIPDVRAKEANVRVSGSGTVHVWVEESLTSRVSGSGDIGFRGTPEHLSTKTSGSGEVFSLN